MASTSTTRRHVHLKDQIAGLTPGREVVVLQLWAGFARNRHAIVTVVNGRKRNLRAGTAHNMREAFALRNLQPGSIPLTDEEARAHLATRGVQRQPCTRCGATLPIGGQWCGECGTAHGAAQ